MTKQKISESFQTGAKRLVPVKSQHTTIEFGLDLPLPPPPPHIAQMLSNYCKILLRPNYGLKREERLIDHSWSLTFLLLRSQLFERAFVALSIDSFKYQNHPVFLQQKPPELALYSISSSATKD